MAHESFEDEATAAYLNEHFVSIKVDREERPDVDAVYMQATVATTGHGGWPMTCVLDHDGRPFFAGTYFPDQPRHGQPSFSQLLQAIHEAWEERREDVGTTAEKIAAHIAANDTLVGAAPIDAVLLDAAAERLGNEFDALHGGFGGSPKFPPSMLMEFLLRRGESRIAPKTLDAMARGGLYDQLGGGFARYSVDARWVVPHFEKMLYDNALLLRVYLHWYRSSGSAFAERVVRETAEFLLRDLRTPEGGFASALDADTNGVEGLTYAWSPAQLVEVLGAEDGAWAAEQLEVTTAGTFDHGLSTLQRLLEPTDAIRYE